MRNDIKEVLLSEEQIAEITANLGKKLTEDYDGQDYWNQREILYATIRGKNGCDVFLGVNLTKEELNAKRKEFLDLGYTIVNERCITSWGGDNREPERKCDPE